MNTAKQFDPLAAVVVAGIAILTREGRLSDELGKQVAARSIAPSREVRGHRQVVRAGELTVVLTTDMGDTSASGHCRVMEVYHDGVECWSDSNAVTRYAVPMTGWAGAECEGYTVVGAA